MSGAIAAASCVTDCWICLWATIISLMPRERRCTCSGCAQPRPVLHRVSESVSEPETGRAVLTSPLHTKDNTVKHERET